MSVGLLEGRRPPFVQGPGLFDLVLERGGFHEAAGVSDALRPPPGPRRTLKPARPLRPGSLYS